MHACNLKHLDTSVFQANSHQSPHGDLGSLNSINDHFQTVALGSSHQCANNFVVPDSSV